MLALTITIVVLLILLNGLFAMSELAVVSSKQARLKTRADQGDKGAAAALKLSEDPTRFLSAVQVGITLIGILAGAYGQATIAAELDAIIETLPGMAPYSEVTATAIVVMILTYLSLILGELVPKRLALIMPETLASVMARPLNLMALIMSPFVSLLTASTAGVLHLLGIKDNKGDSITHEEVETMLAEGAGAGVIEPEEKQMMQEVMRLGDRAIRVAMTPRRDVYWVSLEDDAQTLRDDIRNCPYSRLVVANGASIDEAVGIVHKRDVADALLETGHFDLKALMKAPLIIPESIT
ncbi:MAG: hemolysin family protein, partial [Asticcacaulis sp.]